MILIGRPINGISLNELEYLLDKPEEDGGEPLKFGSKKEAKNYLKENIGDVTEEELKDLFCYEDEESRELL